MDNSAINTSRERTIPIDYMVFCGKTGGEQYQFKYTVQAPVSLCQPQGNGKPPPDPDETGRFLTSIIERYHDDILHRRSWRCVSCNKPAKELLHQMIPFLSPAPDALPEFEPNLLDVASPICRSGGACDRLAEKCFHKFAEHSLGRTKFEASKTCDACGGKTNVKVCAGCLTIA